MDYKEKIIGILTNNELTLEQKRQLEKIFPELKESEDEKIRKALIRYFTLSDEHAYNEACGVSYRDIVVWLKKQGEQNNNEDKDILHRFAFYSYKDESNILYLAGLYVDDEYRNKGIGTKILKVADEVVASMKCNSIRLKVEKGSYAEKLYRENGYTTILEEENQIWLEKKYEQKKIDYNEELKKCKDNPLYFFDKYVKVKLKERKSAWSEKDEKNYQILQNIICDSGASAYLTNKLSDWLKSHKQKLKGE